MYFKIFLEEDEARSAVRRVLESGRYGGALARIAEQIHQQLPSRYEPKVGDMVSVRQLPWPPENNRWHVVGTHGRWAWIVQDVDCLDDDEDSCQWLETWHMLLPLKGDQ